MTTNLSLPREYQLVRLEQCADVAVEAVRLAREGAEEGTLVWADTQSDAVTSSGTRWQSSAGDLHFALILRPEDDRATSLQIVFVTALSLGAVLAEAVAPMTSLHYRWPNDVLLRHGKVAGISLYAEGDGSPFDWMVVSVNLNVKSIHPELEYSAASVEQDGECSVSAEQLLDRFCRYFLTLINRWAEQGFAPLLDSWRQRVPDIGETVSLRVGAKEVRGVLKAIDDEGSVVISSNDSDNAISLGEFFGLQYDQTPGEEDPR